MRENTERPITIKQGTSALVCSSTLVSHVEKILAGQWKKGACPPLWDGNTASRAVAALRARLEEVS
jgi:UDP-N-acetylglucosamine 2-epimerase (non-hydrolysing)